jgi:hypothetical protein
MPLIPSYDYLLRQRSSRIVLSFKAGYYVPLAALFCRDLSRQIPCISSYFTCYIDDPEKEVPEDKHRVQIGILWSNETTEKYLNEFLVTVEQKFDDSFSRECYWEHFPLTETSFLIHFLAKEYGDFLLKTSGPSHTFYNNWLKNFFDGIHLIYNQQLLAHGDLTPRVLFSGFLDELYSKIIK